MSKLSLSVISTLLPILSFRLVTKSGIYASKLPSTSISKSSFSFVSVPILSFFHYLGMEWMKAL